MVFVTGQETDAMDPRPEDVWGDLLTAVSASAVQSADGSLASCAEVRPLPAQLDIWQWALALARQAGWSIPANVSIRWVLAGRGRLRRGETRRWVEGGAIRYAVVVDADLGPEELLRVQLHELRHVSNAVQGRSLSALEEERDAIEASEGLLRSWWR
jgi:hypothetical protein